MADEETKEETKCARCGSGENVALCNPNTPGKPNKKKFLCKKCLDGDSVATLDVAVEVPDIVPAVPEVSTEVTSESVEDFVTKEFGPSEVISTPQNAPPPPVGADPEPVENKPVSTVPIDRQEIRDKISKAHKQLDDAQESKQRILAQIEAGKLTESERNKVLFLENSRNKLQQVNAVISIKNVEIASYRGILGNEG